MSDNRNLRALDRVRKYIAEYEDAPSWGGPTIYPEPPSIDDLRALLAEISTETSEENRWPAPYVRRAKEDLATEVRKLPADFPNYADWPVTLPAGHWRALTSDEQMASILKLAREYRPTMDKDIVHHWGSEFSSAVLAALGPTDISHPELKS